MPVSESPVQTVSKQWRLLPHDPATVDRLARETGLPALLAQILINRGIAERVAAITFVETPMKGLHPPERLPGAAAAAERIWDAVQAKRRICIYGDYDTDGVTGTSILLQVLTVLGGNVDYYVPNRLEEGYGLNIEAVRQLAAGGTELLVTVDCGIASIAEAAEAKRLGLELIVTDHHEFKPELPDALNVHPRLPGSEYPFAGLSGAGVAFKLAWLVATRAAGGATVDARVRERLLDAVALTALGLVADVMPLHDENRILVKHGLARMKHRPTPGLRALIDAAGLGEAASIRAEDIAFKLAPRLNAAGRLGCARLVVDLLTTPSSERAKDLATFVEGQNQQRQQTERKIVAEAKEQAAQYDGQPALVLASPDWHAGVIGIVAGRLADMFARPTLLISIGADEATGSGRSVAGFELHAALAECDSELRAHGGHAAAAGFRLDPSRVDALREKFVAVAARKFPAGPPVPTLTLDAEVTLASLTLKLVQSLDGLEPYGMGHPRPRFLAAGLKLVDPPRKIGQGERHLSFRVSQGGTRMRAVAWGMADRIDELAGDGPISVAFVPKVNEWNGYRNVEMEVVDFRVGAAPELV
ncbi:MAG: single-stranded-DNA-specific exonuclease RecJ [Gemmataceae bacterium]|nr:single-stranded-DNA-specific exonuclease RecJ [Gemmataceae bacterium]